MKIQLATLSDIPIIQQIVNITWPIAYSEILSKEQLDYMLEKFYSTEALSIEIKKNDQRFYIFKNKNEAVVGFFSIEHFYNLEKKTKLHKVYILPEFQGKGIGKQVINEIINLTKPFDIETIILNVNRFNKALFFYKKIGFEIIETVDVEIGNGYLMEDFLLQLKLSNYNSL